ncbi:MAG: ArsA family ATPase [Acidimicrobiales bacterium]
MNLAELVRDRAIIVCCGSGGVGKTTVAAALAVGAAERGRRVCVVTIDPAKRLADALGLGSLTNEPGRVAGDWSGELWALMLDTKGTFDSLVTRYAANPAQAESIINNRLYRNISGALSGTSEYMAIEKLYQLHDEGGFDLIVVDTPPTRNALDFLNAPKRLTRFLDNRVFRLLITPTRAYMKAVSVATQALLRTMSKVVGTEVVRDTIAFFQAFEGMEQGFRDRASLMLELLGQTDTAFVLVTSPRPDAIEEAMYFADKLAQSEMSFQALVVNRLHPRFGSEDVPLPPGPEGPATSPDNPVLATLRTNLAELRGVAVREEAQFAEVADKVSPAPVARVPFLSSDVHDVAGLEEVATHLFATGLVE